MALTDKAKHFLAGLIITAVVTFAGAAIAAALIAAVHRPPEQSS